MPEREHFAFNTDRLINISSVTIYGPVNLSENHLLVMITDK